MMLVESEITLELTMDYIVAGLEKTEVQLSISERSNSITSKIVSR